jgi:glycosyltransferase involved in cell wall biosynthesis
MTNLPSRLKIIAIGYNTSGTGLTRVMHAIMRRLADYYEIHLLGVGYSGEVVHDRGLTIYPTNPKGGDVFAAFQAIRLIEEIRPSLLFILHDIWTFEYYLRLFRPCRNQLKIIAYIPLDGRILNEEDAAPLEQCDCAVAYTRFSKDEFERAFARLLKKRETGDFPPVEIIPHGVDLDRFHPSTELVKAHFNSNARAEAKRKLFGDFSDVDRSFVVLNASRPDKRKRIDLTIAGFAKFAADKPASVRLCLHQAIRGEAEENQIASLVQTYGVAGRTFFNPLAGGVVDDEQLNLLYNACDVGLNTSMGEGWGLVSFEHAATGAVQIVPDHSACREIWNGRGELIPISRSYIPEFSILEMSEVSADSVAQSLQKLYSNPEHQQALAVAGYELTQRDEYSWDSIAKQFDHLFASIARSDTVERHKLSHDEKQKEREQCSESRHRDQKEAR